MGKTGHRGNEKKKKNSQIVGSERCRQAAAGLLQMSAAAAAAADGEHTAAHSAAERIHCRWPGHTHWQYWQVGGCQQHTGKICCKITFLFIKLQNAKTYWL